MIENFPQSVDSKTKTFFPKFQSLTIKSVLNKKRENLKKILLVFGPI